MRTEKGIEVTESEMEIDGVKFPVYSWPVTDDDGEPIILTPEEGFWYSGDAN